MLADTEALIDADWLALTEIDAEFWLLDAEADWLADTDADWLALMLALTDALADWLADTDAESLALTDAEAD